MQNRNNAAEVLDDLARQAEVPIHVDLIGLERNLLARTPVTISRSVDLTEEFSSFCLSRCILITSFVMRF